MAPTASGVHPASSTTSSSTSKSSPKAPMSTTSGSMRGTAKAPTTSPTVKRPSTATSSPAARKPSTLSTISSPTASQTASKRTVSHATTATSSAASSSTVKPRASLTSSTASTLSKATSASARTVTSTRTSTASGATSAASASATTLHKSVRPSSGSTLATKDRALRTASASTVEKLKTRISELEAQLVSAAGQSEEEKGKAAASHLEEISQLKVALEEKGSIIDTLTTELNNLTAAAAGAEQIGAEKDQALALLEERDKTISGLQAELTLLQEQEQFSQEIRQAHLSEHQSLQKTIEDQAASIADKEATLSAFSKEIQALKEIIRIRDVELSQAHDIISTRDTDLKFASSAHSAALAARDEELNYSRDALSSSRQKILDLEEEAHMSKVALNTMKEDMNRILSAPPQVETVQDPELVRQNDEFQQKIERLQEDLEMKEEKIAQMSAMIEEMKASHESKVVALQAELAESTSSLRTELERASDSFNESQLEIQQLKTTILQASTSLEQSLTEKQSLTDELSRLQSEFATFKAEAEELRASAVADASSRSSGEVLALNTSLEEMKESKNMLEVQLKETKEALQIEVDKVALFKEQEDEKAQLEAEVGRLREELEEVQISFEKSESDVYSLKKALVDAEAAFKAMEAQKGSVEVDSAEVEGLKMKVRVLEKELEGLGESTSHQLSEKAKEVDELKAQLVNATNSAKSSHSLKEALEVAQSELHQLKSQLDLLVPELDGSLAEKLTTMTESRDREVGELTTKNQQLEESVAAMVLLQEKHQEALARLAELESQEAQSVANRSAVDVADAAKSVSVLEEKLSAAQSDLVEKQAKIDDFSTKIADLERQLERRADITTQDLEHLQISLKKSEDDVETLSTRCGSLQEEVDKLKGQVSVASDMEATMNAVLEEAEKLRRELEGVKNEKGLVVEEMEGLKKDHSVKVGELEEAMKRYEREIEFLKGEVDEKSRILVEAENAKSALAEASQLNATQATRISTLEAQLMERLAEIESLKGSLSSTPSSTDFEELSIKLSSTQTALKEAQSKLLTLQQEAEEAKDNASALRDALDSTQTKSIEIQEKLSAELDASLAKLKSLEKSLETQAKEGAQQLAKVEGELAGLKKDLADSEEIVSQLRLQLDTTLANANLNVSAASEALQEELEVLRGRLRDAEAMLEDADLKAQLKAASAMDDTVNMLRAQVQEKARELESAEGLIEELKRKLAELTENKNLVDAKLESSIAEDVAADVQDLKNQLKQVGAQRDELLKENEEIERHLEEMGILSEVTHGDLVSNDDVLANPTKRSFNLRVKLQKFMSERSQSVAMNGEHEE
ncbi:hypothetical protein HDV05_007057 [Chytridiales sp. JEL 0842]|nr:hypothetical protein HDV05_007057 [Chytridiales sp. JEL 0842]